MTEILEFSWIKFVINSVLFSFIFGKIFEIGLNESLLLSLTKCSITLKPIMGLAITLLLTINDTVNLFCRFGMLKSKVTIPIIFISVLFAVLKVKLSDLSPTNFSIESIWMSLNSVFGRSKFTRLMLLVFHSPSKFLSFKVKFIMGLCPIRLTNFVCWFGFRGVSYDILKFENFWFYSNFSNATMFSQNVLWLSLSKVLHLLEQ